MELLKNNIGTNIGRSAYDEEDIVKEKFLAFCDVPRSKAEIQAYLGIKSESYTRQKILLPLLESGELVRTIPEKPKSKNQKYISSRADHAN